LNKVKLLASLKDFTIISVFEQTCLVVPRYYIINVFAVAQAGGGFCFLNELVLNDWGREWMQLKKIAKIWIMPVRTSDEFRTETRHKR